MLAIGIAGSSAYDSVGEARARPRASRSRSATTGSPTVPSRSGRGRTRLEVRAVFDVERGGERLGVVEAGKNAYTVERQVSNEVGMRSELS